MVLQIETRNAAGLNLVDFTNSIEADLLPELLQYYHSSAAAFVSSPARSPREAYPSTRGPSLYVAQGEWAVCKPTGPRNQHPLVSLGSDDSTTCIILIVRDPVSKSTAVAHIDSPARAQSLSDLERGLREGRPARASVFDTFVSGGLPSDYDSALNLAGVLSELAKSEEIYRLRLAVACDLNTFSGVDVDKDTQAIPSARVPAVRGLALHLPSGTPFHAMFEDNRRGPLFTLRSLRSLFDDPNRLACVYLPPTVSATSVNGSDESIDHEYGRVVVEPFPWPKGSSARWLRQLASMPDAELLEEASTSPAYENQRFTSDMRKMIALANEVNGEATAFGEKMADPKVACVKEGSDE